MEYFTDAIRNYARFTGRATRQQYWMYILFYILFYIILSGLTTSMDLVSETLSALLGVLLGLYSLGLLIPTLAIAVRRLHDTGRSGLWLLLNFIPLIGSIILLIWLCTDSQPGDNIHGPNLKANTVSG